MSTSDIIIKIHFSISNPFYQLSRASIVILIIIPIFNHINIINIFMMLLKRIHENSFEIVGGVILILVFNLPQLVCLFFLFIFWYLLPFCSLKEMKKDKKRGKRKNWIKMKIKKEREIRKQYGILFAIIAILPLCQSFRY